MKEKRKNAIRENADGAGSAGRRRGQAAGRSRGRRIAGSIAFTALAAAVFIVLFSLAGLPGSLTELLSTLFGPHPTLTLTPSPSPVPSPTPSPEPDLTAQAVIMATGDIILHQSLIDGAKTSSGGYDFDHLFTYVRPYFQSSDITAANFEGTLSGPDYSGYPAFNAPDEIAAAIRKAGIGLVTTANNHAYDRGIAGLRRTPDIFRQAGVSVVGTRSDPADPPFVIADLNGIRTGFTGYTYETVGTAAQRALNGITMVPEAQGLIDSFNWYRPDRFESDMQGMAERIAAMKKAGAECIVFILHWGDEYQSVSNRKQRDLAQFLADHGVDIIIGHHPHVLQEISVVPSQVSGKNTLVYYSLGNVVANMGYNTHSTAGRAEDAVIARIVIARSRTGTVTVQRGEYIKTYIFKDESSGKRIHRILPVAAAIADPDAFSLTSADLALVKASDKRISEGLGGSDGIRDGIVIGEYR